VAGKHNIPAVGLFNAVGDNVRKNNMYTNVIATLKNTALPIINAICVLVQMYAAGKMGIIVSDIRDWSKLPFPANGDFLLWLSALLFAVVWLVMVSVSTNRRLRITLTVINACITMFLAFCLIIAEVG
jgi:hypothetical protein